MACRRKYSLPGQQLQQLAARALHTTRSLAKHSVSIVPPVHHRVRYKKNVLMPRYQQILNTPKWDPRSHAFKPQVVQPSRLQDHYDVTLAPDLMAASFVPGEQRVPGRRPREWDGSSPYHLNRAPYSPAGSVRATPAIRPRTFANVPKLQAIWVHAFVNAAVRYNTERVLPTTVAMQQITGKKPTPVYSKSAILPWKLRRNQHVAAKVEIKGHLMHQFFATLVEIVLPRIKDYKGVPNSSGDKYGNISFGLEPNDVKLFPELEGSPDLWKDVSGLYITIVTTAQTDPEARTLLSAMGLPFVGRERFHNVPSLDALLAGSKKKGVVYDY